MTVLLREHEARDTSMGGRLFPAVDVSSLVAFRILFGSLLAWEIVRDCRNGVVTSRYLIPIVRFPYHGFEWVPALPREYVSAYMAALCAIAVMVAVGFCYRASATLLFVGFCHLLLIDKAFYLNHEYLICLIAFLMIFAPSSRAYSIDAIMAKSKSRAVSLVPCWSLWMLRVQIALVYIFAGLAKLNPDWLHGQPMRMWFAPEPSSSPDFWLDGRLWPPILTYGGLLLDLCIVPLLLWKRTRWLAFGLAVVFHLTNAFLFRIGVFPWMMIAATTLFLPPDWPRQLVRRLGLRRVAAAAVGPPPVSAYPNKWVASLMIFYCLVQVVLPLRHLLYPGNVDWTEEGSRFAWRLMLRDKQGWMRFIVETPHGDRQEVSSGRFLTRKQEDALIKDPEIARQFCHVLREDYRRTHGGDASVRVLTSVSLNGRKGQLLINPVVDLSAEPWSIRPARWIIPLLD
ncbi:MAG: HTTM domain-containing protein [Isosphaeraceae bacterium]|nr:HTTM domain-containing protein [Isosphaeraceae bacterium]